MPALFPPEIARARIMAQHTAKHMSPPRRTHAYGP